jgi:energy-coupling factor transporter transmembrane protein EcfT
MKMIENKYGFWPNRRCILIGIKSFVLILAVCLFLEWFNAFILHRPGYGEWWSVLFVVSQAIILGCAISWLFYMREFDKHYEIKKR